VKQFGAPSAKIVNGDSSVVATAWAVVKTAAIIAWTIMTTAETIRVIVSRHP
jgi:hypothetical protein